MANSRWCKNDMKARRVPCIVVVNDFDGFDDRFSTVAGDDAATRIYMGDAWRPGIHWGGFVIG